MQVADAVREVPGGVEIAVFCQPRAARSAVAGMHAGALKVKVRAPALEGRANEALLDLLGDVLGVPRARLALAGGAHSRLKRVQAAGLSAPAAAEILGAHLAKNAGREG